MNQEAVVTELLNKEQCWEKVLQRFASIDTQLQQLYWEVLSCIEEESQE